MCCSLNFTNRSMFLFTLLSTAKYNYFPMQNIFLMPIRNPVSTRNIAYYKVLPKNKSSFGGMDWGLHSCKETHKICKNELFLEFLAYLHFVAW